MTGAALTMMIISLTLVWGGLAVVATNLIKRGTDRD